MPDREGVRQVSGDHSGFDHQVAMRAWGIDDPRVVKLLAEENTPIRRRRRGPRSVARAHTIGERARAAGWPPEVVTVQQQRKWMELGISGDWRITDRTAIRGRRADTFDGGVVTIFDE